MTRDPIKTLEYVNEVLNGLRFAGTDQNPKGIRDLLYSAISELKKQACK